MSPASNYFARIGGELRGPFTAGQLRDFAEAGVISRDTEVASARSGPWLKADALPEREIIFPPPVRFGFRATNYNVANPRDASPGADVDGFVQAAQIAGPVLRPHRDEEALASAAVPKPAEPLNEVQAMVNEVNALEARFAPPRPPPPKRKMRGRLKIVLALAVAGNAALAALPFAYDAFGDYVSMLGFKAWLITFNGALVILYFTQGKD